MNYTLISGSWRYTNRKIEEDVRTEVQRILEKENSGIISGGALGVDFFATDEALILDPNAERILVFLPTTLVKYAEHYLKRAAEGIIHKQQARKLIGQLEVFLERNPSAIIENPRKKVVSKREYFERIRKMVDVATDTSAFQVNKSGGVQYSIDYTRSQGKKARVKRYTIPLG